MDKIDKTINKRRSPRAQYVADVYYPHVNNKWESENQDPNTPVIKTLNISDSGMSFLSKVAIKVGDFISFFIKIEDNPSFQCLGEVKWVEAEQENFVVGCQFYTITDDQLSVIRKYVEKSKN